MLREAAIHIDWCEMTMSMMREKQFEACERRLSACTGIGLFSDEATDADAQTLYGNSYEHGRDDTLVTIDMLRRRVLHRLPLEARYLCEEERQLVENLLMNDGELVLGDWDDLGAAESLVRRLWCGLAIRGENRVLYLPHKLHKPLTNAFSKNDDEEVRRLVANFNASINGLLYITGMLHSLQPMACFMREVMKREDSEAAEIARRYLMASFEYIEAGSGDMMLLHPGLADPYRLIGSHMSDGHFTLEMAQGMLLGGMKGILPEEESLHERMCGSLMGALRPDYDAFECAEDIRMLAKQGVSYTEMESVLSSMLAVMPTDYMKAALRELYSNTPRWMSLKAAVAN